MQLSTIQLRALANTSNAYPLFISNRIYKRQSIRQTRRLRSRAEDENAQPASSTPDLAPNVTADTTVNQAEASAPSIESAPIKTVTWRTLLDQSVLKLKANFWPLVLVHLLCDVVVFMLHRGSHRLTNQAAVSLLSSGLTPEVIGNMWWLSADPAIANFQTGYQALTIAVFIVAFPLNVLLKTGASIATLLICRDDLGVNTNNTFAWWNVLKGLRSALPSLKTLKPIILACWYPVFIVELMVAAVVVPLQFASLAVVTLPLTLPVILDLQAAAPAAVLEGKQGMDAIKRSWALVRPLRWRLAIPFVGLVVAQRLAEAVKGWALTSMPPRYYRELVELPIVIMVGGAVLSLVLARLHDVLPYAAYEQAKMLEAERLAGGNGSSGEDSDDSE